MADVFARVTNAVLPVYFDSYWSRATGIPRIYSLDRDGLLVGSNTTTYGFDFSGAYGGNRARNTTEAQWGNTSIGQPNAVGRLWDGKTLRQLAYRPVIGTASPLSVSLSGGAETNITVPVGAGRQFLTCTLTADGRHLLFITAPAGSLYGSGTGDQWHICSWSGSAFVHVSSGTIAKPVYEYMLGPGTSGSGPEAGMMESDLTHVWNVRTGTSSLEVFRIGADAVLRSIKVFKPEDGVAASFVGDAYPALYADKGLCAVVSASHLTIFTRVALVDEPVAGLVATPFDGYSLRLVQIDNGRFDLAFYDPSQGDGPAVETLVYAALFTDAEAPARREPDRYQRRGWWADAEAGSGLWHVRRQPLGGAARREAIEMVRDALEAHGITGVDVQEVAGIPSNVSSLVLKITGFYAGRQFVMDVPL